MKIGKLPENVLVRSVLRQVKHRRDEVLVGPSVGRDCAALQLKEDEVLVMSADPITGTTMDLGNHCIQVTANDIAAAGAEPIGVMLTIMLPEEIKEPEIRMLMKDIEAACEALKMEVLGGHTETTSVVRQPLVCVTGVGKMRRDVFEKTSVMRPHQDVVITKWIGLEATAILAKEKEEQLLTVFSPDFIDTGKKFASLLSVVPEAQIAMENGVSAMHDITEGGVFGAFWEMAEAGGCGLEINMKKIPIRQETIEICEFFGLNPYMIMSSGSMLMSTDEGEQLVRALAKEGIAAAVVGRTTDGNDRILRNGEEIRYLDRPQTDELYKVMR